MKLERYKEITREGFKFVSKLKDITGKDNIIVPKSVTTFYDLCDLYDKQGTDYKIYNTQDFDNIIVEVKQSE